MKKLLLFLFILAIQSFPQQERYYTFSELRGMEDNSGNTHLFYRMYSSWSNASSGRSNNVYHFDSNYNKDTLFLSDYSYYSDFILGSNIILDFDFWDNNPEKFIQCGTGGSFFKTSAKVQSPITYIQRFDSEYENHGNISGMASVCISQQNDSILYGSNGMLISSSDGGWTWNETDNYDYTLLEVSPYNDSIQFYYNDDGRLYKTFDAAKTFALVDTNTVFPQKIYDNMFFDRDSNHIYLVVNSGSLLDPKHNLLVSDSEGDAFTWSKKFTGTNIIYLSVDYSQSGHIYLADGRFIYHSTDFGKTFSLFKELDRKVVGIYKKPGSELLYAATKYDLYEITSDTIITLKHLQFDPALFSWFPLDIGNKWYYENTEYAETLIDSWNSVWEVVDHIEFNGKYFAEIDIINSDNDAHETQIFFRPDSSNGKIYKTLSLGAEIDEHLFVDLSSDIADTVSIENDFYVVVFAQTEPYTLFDLNTQKRTYEYLYWGEINIANGFGIVDDIEGELYYHSKVLKGAVINGNIYGDTTLVGVDDELPVPYQFSLSQNYPNPFNPVTKIKYAIGSRQYASIKVYDILGNEIATLVNEEKPAGEYEVEFDGGELSSGVYMYKLIAGQFSQSKKLLLLK